MKKLYPLLMFFCLSYSSAIAQQSPDQFDVAGATGTVVTGINDQSFICGYCTLGGVDRAFFYNGVDTFILPQTTIANAVNISFMGINNVGQIVGCWNYGNAVLNKAFLWGYISHNIDTNLAINASGYTNIFPTDINDYSVICGNASNGTDRRFWQLSGTNIQFIQHHLDGAGTVTPTYAGGVQTGGTTTGSYIDNGSQVFGFTFNVLTLHYDTMDFVFENQHKTLPRGINDSGAIVFEVAAGAGAFVLRGPPPYFDPHSGDSLSRIVIPRSTAVHPYDINNKFQTCGYYADSVGASHGFFERTYDIKFRPNATGGDAWEFGNTEGNLWPSSEYISSGFYLYDPVLHSSNWEVPHLTPTIRPSAFPSWNLFVENFGQSNCYIGNLVVLAKEHAWLNHIVEWGGSCFGMSTTSIMHFQHPDSVYRRFPIFTPIPNLSDYGPLHIRIDPINQAQISQTSTQYVALIANADRELEGVVRDLKEHMLDTTRNYPVIGLSIWSLDNKFPISKHAVVPYKIERNPVSLNEEIFVYDPNRPGNTDVKIILYPLEGEDHLRTWKFSWVSANDPQIPPVWGPSIIDQNFGLIGGEMYLIDPGPVFGPTLSPSNAAPVQSPIANNARSVTPSPLQFFVNDSTAYFVTDVNNDTVMNINGRGYLNIPGAFPLTPISGFAAYTNSLLFPENGTYNALVKSYQNNNILAGLTTTTGASLFFQMDSSATIQNHQLAMDTFLSYTNPDADLHNIKLTATSLVGNDYYTFSLSNLPVAHNQAIKIQPENNGDELRIWNTGNQTKYVLDVAVEGSTPKYLHFDSIPFIANSTHLIKFINDSSSSTGIWIIVTQGGSIVDTIFYQNQLTPVLQLSKGSALYPVTSGTDTIGVSNVGAGTLSWKVVSVPSWITITQGDTGTQQGNIIYNYAANGGNARVDYIIVNTVGTNVYDSVQVSQNGILGIAENEIDGRNIILYPNPATSELHLKSDDNSLLNADIKVFDLNGRVVLNVKSESASDVSVNIASLNPGPYVISVNGEKALARKMFVKF